MPEPGSRSSRGRGLGASLGDAFELLARRVSTVVAEVSETVSLPEPVRVALEQARKARIRGEYIDAREILTRARDSHPQARYFESSLALTWLADELFGESDTNARAEAMVDGEPGEGALHHVRLAVVALEVRDTSGCHDELRRAHKHLSRLSAADREELVALLPIIRASAYGDAGEPARALRELRKAQAQLRPEDSPAYRWLVRTGTAVFLVLDRADAGHEWLHALRLRRTQHAEPVPTHEEPVKPDESEASVSTPSQHRGRPLGERGFAPEREHRAADGQSTNAVGGIDLLDCERAALLRFAAARGDESTVASLLGTSDFAPSPELRLLIAIQGHGEDAVSLARAQLDARAEDPRAQRLWALAQICEAAHTPIDPTSVARALSCGLEQMPPPLRLAHLQELAHVALRFDVWSSDVLHAIERGSKLATRVPRELALYLARARANDGGTQENANNTTPSRSLDATALAVAIETDDTAGPDELSPLRNAVTRYRVLAGQQQLLRAQLALCGGLRAQAQAALVDALSEDPDLAPAQRLLVELAQPEDVRDLEGALATATDLLSAIPHDASNTGVDAVATASQQIIKARERLARPLTIAVMGEFSAGKSTFVNALLGASVAPMGVLPTTSTINVFRPGQRGGAYVHLRNGELRHVAADDITTFLRGIDENESKAIRYIELERREGQLGEVVIVDTPGLNALDPYHERVAREFLERADAVIWVFSATRGATASEAEVIDELHGSGRRLLGVLNKIDTVPAEEHAALIEYVSERLADRLDTLVATSAAAALSWRERPDPDDVDPFLPITRAIEETFFSRARQLKRQLTTQQLDDALSLAIDHVDFLASALERAAEDSGSDGDQRLEIRTALARLADAYENRVVSLADTLSRELLALGLMSVDAGRIREPDDQDLSYLASVFEDGVMGLLADATTRFAGARVEQAIVGVVQLRFLPWVRGQLAGLATRRFMSEVVQATGNTVRHGESTLRRAIEHALRPVSLAWRERIVGLRPNRGTTALSRTPT